MLSGLGSTHGNRPRSGSVVRCGRFDRCRFGWFRRHRRRCFRRHRWGVASPGCVMVLVGLVCVKSAFASLRDRNKFRLLTHTTPTREGTQLSRSRSEVWRQGPGSSSAQTLGELACPDVRGVALPRRSGSCLPRRSGSCLARRFGCSSARRQRDSRNRHFVHHLSRSRRPGRSTGAQSGGSDTKSGPRTRHDLSQVPTRCPRSPQPHRHRPSHPRKVSAVPTTARPSAGGPARRSASR